MKRLNPDKLHVEFMPGISPESPIIPRRYTLTHSDITGDLFLTIGTDFAYDKISPMRDEVLARWHTINNTHIFYVYCYVGGQFDRATAAKRFKVFSRELPLALEAMYYGDQVFFKVHPRLETAPVWVYFDSPYPEFNRTESWETFEDYK